MIILVIRHRLSTSNRDLRGVIMSVVILGTSWEIVPNLGGVDFIRALKLQALFQLILHVHSQLEMEDMRVVGT